MIVLDQEFSADPDTVARARHELIGRLRGQDINGRLLDDIALAVSEACTNAVVHGYAGVTATTFHILATIVGDLLEVGVSDHGGGMRTGSPNAGLGLGMPLIETVVDSFDVEQTPGGGTTITMRFAL